MNRKRWLIGLVLFLGMAAGVAEYCRTAEPAAPAEELAGQADLAKMTVLVFLDLEMKSPSLAMTNTEIKKLDGQSFLVGIAADSGHDPDWWPGRKVTVAMRAITGCVLMNKEEFEKYLEETEDASSGPENAGIMKLGRAAPRRLAVGRRATISKTGRSATPAVH